jgi:hypothetical protein
MPAPIAGWFYEIGLVFSNATVFFFVSGFFLIASQFINERKVASLEFLQLLENGRFHHHKIPEQFLEKVKFCTCFNSFGSFGVKGTTVIMRDK